MIRQWIGARLIRIAVDQLDVIEQFVVVIAITTMRLLLATFGVRTNPKFCCIKIMPGT